MAKNINKNDGDNNGGDDDGEISNLFSKMFIEHKFGTGKSIPKIITCFLCEERIRNTKKFYDHLLKTHFEDGENLNEKYGIEYLDFLNKRFKENNRNNDEYRINIPFCSIIVQFNDRGLFNTTFDSISYQIKADEKKHSIQNNGVFNFESMNIVDVFMEIGFNILRKLEVTYRYFKNEMENENIFSIHTEILYYTSKNSEYDVELSNKNIQSRSSIPISSTSLSNNIKTKLTTDINSMLALSTTQQGSGFVLRGVRSIKIFSDRQNTHLKFIGGKDETEKDNKKQSVLEKYFEKTNEQPSSSKKSISYYLSMDDNVTDSDLESDDLSTKEDHDFIDDMEIDSSDEERKELYNLKQQAEKRKLEHKFTKEWRNQKMKKINNAFVQEDKFFDVSPTMLKNTFPEEMNFVELNKFDDDQYAEYLKRFDRLLKVVNGKLNDGLEEKDVFEKFNDELDKDFIKIWKRIRGPLLKQVQNSAKNFVDSSSETSATPTMTNQFIISDHNIKQYEEEEMHNILLSDIEEDEVDNAGNGNLTEDLCIFGEKLDAEQITKTVNIFDVPILSDPDQQNRHALNLFKEKNFCQSQKEKIEKIETIEKSNPEVEKVLLANKKTKLASSEQRKLQKDNDVLKKVGINYLKACTKKLDSDMEKCQDLSFKNNERGFCLVDAVINSLIHKYCVKNPGQSDKRLKDMYTKKLVEGLIDLKYKTKNLEFIKSLKTFKDINEILVREAKMYLNVMVYVRDNDGNIIAHIEKLINDDIYLMMFGNLIFCGNQNDNSKTKVKIESTVDLVFEYSEKSELHMISLENYNGWFFTFNESKKKSLKCDVCSKCFTVLSTKHKQRNIDNHINLCYGDYKIEKRELTNNTYSFIHYFDKVQKSPVVIYAVS